MIVQFYEFNTPAQIARDQREHRGAGIRLMQLGSHLTLFYGETNIEQEHTTLGVFALPQYVPVKALPMPCQVFGRMNTIIDYVADNLAVMDEATVSDMEQQASALLQADKPLAEVVISNAYRWKGIIQECLLPTTAIFWGTICS